MFRPDKFTLKIFIETNQIWYLIIDFNKTNELKFIDEEAHSMGMALSLCVVHKREIWWFIEIDSFFFNSLKSKSFTWSREREGQTDWKTKKIQQIVAD